MTRTWQVDSLLLLLNQGKTVKVIFDLHDQDFRYVLRTPGPVKVRIATLTAEFDLVVGGQVEYFGVGVPETFSPWSSLPIPDPAAAPIQDTPIAPAIEEPPTQEPIDEPEEDGGIPITPFDSGPLAKSPTAPIPPQNSTKPVASPVTSTPTPSDFPLNFPPRNDSTRISPWIVLAFALAIFSTIV